MTDSSVKLGHVHLRIRDLDTAIPFYTEILGLSVAERQGRYTFLSWGENHHDVALQEVGQDAPGPSDGVGLYHVAFEVADREALKAVYTRLQEHEIEAHPVDHGISKALYLKDPSGNGIEIFVDTRDGKESEWGGTNQLFNPAEL